MAGRWYYQLLNEEFGPVTEQEIRDLVQVGTLADNDLVRREDNSRWCALAEMHQPAAVAVSDGGPSDLGDLSELSFSFEESSALPEIADDSSLLRMDEIRFEDESHRPSPRLRSRAVESADVESPAETWYYESLGNVLGPMPLQSLIEMADRGMITDGDRVRSSENATWVPFADVPELAAACLSISPVSSQATATRNSATPSVKAVSGANGPFVDQSPAAEQAKIEDGASRRKTGNRDKQQRLRPKKKRQAMTNEEFAAQLASEAAQAAAPPPPDSEVDAAAAVPAPAGVSTGDVAADTNATAEKNVPAAPSAPSHAPPPVPQPAVAAASMAPPKPPRRPRRKISMPSLPSLSMGDGGTKKIVLVGLVAVLLAIGFFTGTISLSMLGFTPSPASALPKYSAEYESMAASTITSSDWRDFGSRVRPVLHRIKKRWRHRSPGPVTKNGISRPL